MVAETVFYQWGIAMLKSCRSKIPTRAAWNEMMQGKQMSYRRGKARRSFLRDLTPLVLVVHSPVRPRSAQVLNYALPRYIILNHLKDIPTVVYVILVF